MTQQTEWRTLKQTPLRLFLFNVICLKMKRSVCVCVRQNAPFGPNNQKKKFSRATQKQPRPKTTCGQALDTDFFLFIAPLSTKAPFQYRFWLT